MRKNNDPHWNKMISTENDENKKTDRNIQSIKNRNI